MENEVDTVICLRMGKTYKAKTSLGDFKVIIPKNQLLSQQVVTSKVIAVPYTNLQLNSYLNIQLDLFCSNNKYVTNQSMHGSKDVTNHQLKKDVGWKVLQFINTMKIMKLFGSETLWHTNATTSSRERWTRAYVSGHNMIVKNFCIKLH